MECGGLPPLLTARACPCAVNGGKPPFGKRRQAAALHTTTRAVFNFYSNVHLPMPSLNTIDSFLKWTAATRADEVTREMAEEYTRHIFYPKKGLPSARQMRYSVTFNERLRGWVKFPTGGKARDCLAIARH